MSYEAGLVDFSYKAKKEDKEATVVKVYYPTIDELVTALSNVETPEHTSVLTACFNGLKQIIRNQVVGGYPVPSTMAIFLANEAARTEAASNKGEALKVRREGIEAFVAFAIGAGVSEAACASLKKWLNSSGMSALEAQPEGTRNNIDALANKWVDSLNDAEVIKYDKLLTSIGVALKGATVEADAFSIG